MRIIVVLVFLMATMIYQACSDESSDLGELSEGRDLEVVVDGSTAELRGFAYSPVIGSDGSLLLDEMEDRGSEGLFVFENDSANSISYSKPILRRDSALDVDCQGANYLDGVPTFAELLSHFNGLGDEESAIYQFCIELTWSGGEPLQALVHSPPLELHRSSPGVEF